MRSGFVTKIWRGKMRIFFLKAFCFVRATFVELEPLLRKWKESVIFLETWRLSDALVHLLSQLHSLLTHPQIAVVLASFAANMNREVWWNLGSRLKNTELVAIRPCLESIVERINIEGHLFRIEIIVKRELERFVSSYT
eukprot:Gregarina_sp_Poly_1__318@NODE_1078_length_5165_cov_88_419969_g749_i0_p6_GENE_NODE_1078_length_5165_cov_88_419969_g749_i0NODE_1078_length_5165_cov_88_419969_g749_i0_p6_ORF_typecomplete_len139_score10_48_NODE_1078_length_5165_cov_88_419969_g749_i039294345